MDVVRKFVRSVDVDVEARADRIYGEKPTIAIARENGHVNIVRILRELMDDAVGE